MNNARNVGFKFEALFSAAVTVQGMTGAVYYYLIVAAEYSMGPAPWASRQRWC